MLSINDLEPGSIIVVEGAPFQVLEVAHQHIGRGGSSIQTKIRNLKTGQVYNRNYKPADTFPEADVEKKPLTFLYAHRGEFIFTDPANPKNRFTLNEEQVGENIKWLKKNTQVEAVFFNEELLGFSVPIKMDFEITEAPPGIQGDRSSAGTKAAVIETGATIQVPLFINMGDVIRVNTVTGEYAERVAKG